MIRTATEQDLPAISGLQHQWCDEDITWGMYADTLDDLRAFVGRYGLVAEIEGAMVGYILGRVGSSNVLAALPPEQECLEIVELYVVPEKRSQGIGSLLLDELLARAKADGIPNFRLFSGAKETARVVSFYERHGFTMVGVDMVRRRG